MKNEKFDAARGCQVRPSLRSVVVEFDPLAALAVVRPKIFDFCGFDVILLSASCELNLFSDFNATATRLKTTIT